MRRALIIGVDYYKRLRKLHGCVNDAIKVHEVLERNEDGTLNFMTPKMLLGRDRLEKVSKRDIKDATAELFSGGAEIELFYFAGHGHLSDTGGYLCTSETERGDEGFSLDELMTYAIKSSSTNKIIILDSCHSGHVANSNVTPGLAQISSGMTILTAASSNQYADENSENGIPGGVFTTLFVDAMHGGAANLMGEITLGSIYAHIDKSLGTFRQRPIFKTNVSSFISLRKTTPPISLIDLKRLPQFFSTPDYFLQLDPSYEPDRWEVQRNDPNIPPPDPAKTIIFRALQNMVKVNLVRPVGEVHMYWAAINSKGCELTTLGQHYWRLVSKGLL